MNMQAKGESPATKLARQVQFAFERELDAEKASKEVAHLVMDAFQSEEKQPYFVPFLTALLNDPETTVHAANALAALYWAGDTPQSDQVFLSHMLERAALGHWQKDLPDYRHDESGKVFSAYAYALGECFIQLMHQTSDNYDILSELYSKLIRQEMDKEAERLSQKMKKGKKLPDPVGPTNAKKLYDDIFDYISERAVFRSETLNQVNPNEYIILLADRLRATRRYCMQDVMNKNALAKKKLLEKQLKEREASAEEIIQTYQPFKNALGLFAEAKRYNLRYMEMEKKRITLQLMPTLLATACLGAGFMDLYQLNAALIVIFVGGIITPQFIFTRKLMQGFYPVDVSSDLEQEVVTLVSILKKCSQAQLTSIINRLLKDISDTYQLGLLPDFLTYVYAVMPDRKVALVNRDQLEETQSRLRQSILFRQRQLLLN